MRSPVIMASSDTWWVRLLLDHLLSGLYLSRPHIILSHPNRDRQAQLESTHNSPAINTFTMLSSQLWYWKSNTRLHTQNICNFQHFSNLVQKDKHWYHSSRFCTPPTSDVTIMNYNQPPPILFSMSKTIKSSHVLPSHTIRSYQLSTSCGTHCSLIKSFILVFLVCSCERYKILYQKLNIAQ